MGFFTSKVIQLTPKNFQNDMSIVHSKIDGSTIGLIVFYADWCGYCKRMAPEYSNVAEILGDSFPLFAFDCVKHKEFCSSKLSMVVKSYPTLLYINKNGTLGHAYKNERTADEFLADICKKSSGKACKN